MKKIYLPVLFCIALGTTFGQAPSKKNTVRVNITNPLIFGKDAFIFGYERIVSKRQSFSIDIGKMSLPKFAGGTLSDSLQLKNNFGDKGFHVSADYRFYLAKENKYEAPRGVYLGPYYSYNYFSRSNEWLLNSTGFNGLVNTGTRFDIHTAGIELGYQFVFWNRFSVDMVLMGPGVGIYKLKTGINTNLSPEQEEIFFEKLNGYLKDKIPGYSMVIKEGEFVKNGTMKTTSFGFRYMINLGFRF